MSRFLWFTVYVCTNRLGKFKRSLRRGSHSW